MSGIRLVELAPRDDVDFSASPSSPVLCLRSRSVEDLAQDLGAEADTLVGSVTRVSHGWRLPDCASDGQLLRFILEKLPEDVVVCAETAAAIYGVDVRPQSRGLLPFRLCLSRRGRLRSLRRPGVYCRSMDVADEDVEVLHGLRVTSPVRTVFDVACSVSLERAVWVVERFCQLGLVSLRGLWSFAHAHAGRRGVRIFRRALGLADVRSESPQETAVRLRLLEAGFGRVRPQLRVWRRCGAFFRVDLGFRTPVAVGDISCGGMLFPGCRGIAVEYDGVAFHPSEGRKWREDQARLRELKSLGWLPIVVRAEDLVGLEPTFERVVAEAMERLWGVRHRVGVRAKWGLTKMNWVRNAWSRPFEPWWRLWEGER